MEYKICSLEQFEDLIDILNAYKNFIGEQNFEEDELKRLKSAIIEESIIFYIAIDQGKIIGVCSISKAFTTFNCYSMGIFEDFYILLDYRGKGIARELVNKVFNDCRIKGIRSIWVGCCDDDINMYDNLGFNIKLGNLLTHNQ